MEKIEGGVTAVPGYSATGKHIGIKKRRHDLGLIYSENLCTAAGMFTANKVKGAPVKVTMDHIKDGKAQAIVVNSGIANVATGAQGVDDAKIMAASVAKELGIAQQDVLVASTGLIGKPLPIEKIIKGLKGIKDELSGENSENLAEAMLTTDTKTKRIAVKAGKAVIGGVAKGSGMIHPNMATMLAFITTDAEIDAKNLKKMLKTAVDKSFNMISIDAQTSTSDMVLMLASGTAGKIPELDLQVGLNYVCMELAKMIAADGEGATKLIKSICKGAATDSDAQNVARAIVSSDLVKCAVHGSDPNWGRIMCAVGNADAKIDEGKIKIFINGYQVTQQGMQNEFDAKTLAKKMKSKQVEIGVWLGLGDGYAMAYGCDLSEKYVKINSDYQT